MQIVKGGRRLQARIGGVKTTANEVARALSSVRCRRSSASRHARCSSSALRLLLQKCRAVFKCSLLQMVTCSKQSLHKQSGWLEVTGLSNGPGWAWAV